MTDGNFSAVFFNIEFLGGVSFKGSWCNPHGSHSPKCSRYLGNTKMLRLGLEYLPT